MRHAHMMGAREPLLHRLVPVLVRQMGAAYPEIVRAEALVDRDAAAGGDALPLAARARPRPAGGGDGRGSASGQALPGEVAFRLYDTYGFPLDLTQDALRAEGRAVDVAGFEAAMAEQRTPRPRRLGRHRARRRPRRLWFDLKEKRRRHRVPRLLHRDRRGRDPGHRGGRRGRWSGAPAGAEVAVVLNQTPFYAESGGQVGDTGLISAGEACRIVVRDTQKKLGDLFVHLGTVAHGEARLGPRGAGGGGPRAARRHPRASLRDAPAARGAAAAARRRTWRRRAA